MRPVEWGLSCHGSLEEGTTSRFGLWPKMVVSIEKVHEAAGIAPRRLQNSEKATWGHLKTVGT